MRPELSYYKAAVWFTALSRCGNILRRKCINADNDLEAFRIAESLSSKGYTQITIRKQYTNHYQPFKKDER